MDPRPFDHALAWVAGVALLVVGVGCTAGARWVVPPEDGVGPYAGPGRVHNFQVVVVVAVVFCAVCLYRAYAVWSGVPLFAAAMAVLVVGVLGLAIFRPRVEIELRADGFAGGSYRTPIDSSLPFFNTSGSDVTVCLGIAGDCDSAAAGPAGLRPPGLTVAPNHRMSVTTPRKAGDFRITIVNLGGGVTRRDAELHTYVPDSGP